MRFAMFIVFSAITASAQAVPSGHSSQSAHIAPADMLDRLDRFRDSLSSSDRSRLDRALPRSRDGGIARCDRTDGSRASCEATAYMLALRATGLMQRFRAATIARRS